MITPETLNVASLKDKFDTDAYLSPHSDIVALLVFEHQMRMMNLITRVGWEVRVAVHDKQTEKLPGLLREAPNSSPEASANHGLPARAPQSLYQR